MKNSPGKFVNVGKRYADNLLTEPRIVFIDTAFMHHDRDARTII